MPIDVEELGKAKRPLRENILAFLNSNRGQAFSLVEIYAKVEGYSETSAALVLLARAMSRNFEPRGLLKSYQDALQALKATGKVQLAVVRGETYYAADGEPQ